MGHELYVVAGGSGRRFLNDVHVLDTQTHAWRRAECGGATPPARAGHAMAENDGKVRTAPRRPRSCQNMTTSQLASSGPT